MFHDTISGNDVHGIRPPLEGAGSPLGSVTPAVVGELYRDTGSQIWYRSVGLTSADWVVFWTPTTASLSFPDYFSATGADNTHTGNTTYQLAASISQNLAAGDYEALCGYGWGYSAVNRDFLGRLSHTPPGGPKVTIWEHRQEPKDSNANQRNSAGGGFPLPGLLAGVHLFELEYTVQNAGDTARIYRPWLSLSQKG